MSRAGRDVRTLLVLVVGTLLTLGTFVGDDDEFPFGPFRMYSTATKASGRVHIMTLEARVGDGPWRGTAMSPGNIGVNRADVEGQVPEVQARPEMLGDLAEAHARMHPDDEPWTGVRLVRRDAVLADRRLTGETVVDVLAEWTR